MQNHKLLVAILIGAVVWLSACGAPNTQQLGTPMPTMIPATPPQFIVLPVTPTAAGQQTCQVHAVDLLGAWASAGAPETDPFSFTSVSGDTCKGTFAADIQPLFKTSNLWYEGAPACVVCHYADVGVAWAQLDLSSYAGIMAGSRRPSDTEKGGTILGDGNWEKAILLTQLKSGRMPPGGAPGRNPQGPVVSAGLKQ
jgi:hypothetical protein